MLALFLALILALPVPLIMALAPDLVVNYTQHDVFIPLDAAWRTLQGQWPHLDVFTPLGLAYFWQHGAAAWLWGLDGRVVIRANFVALPFVLVPAVVLAWRRLNTLSAMLLVVVLTVLVTAPTFIDGPERLVANLANYNRIGAAMCGVVCLWALCPPRRANAAAFLVETLLVGLVLLILFYLKVTFFGLACAIAAVGCVIMPRLWLGAIGAGLVVILGILGLEMLHPGLLAAYIADILRVGTSSTQVFRGYYAPAAVVANFGSCALIAALAFATAWFAPGQRLAMAGIVAVAGGCVIAATQNFGAFSPQMLVLTMIVGQRLGTVAQRLDTERLDTHRLGTGADPAASATRPVLETVGLVAVVMATAPFLITQIGGTLYEAQMTRSKGFVLDNGKSDTIGNIVWFQNAVERAFLPTHFTMAEAATWGTPLVPAALAVPILNDGIDLLRRDGLAGMRIENLAFSNPFPLALRAPSARGVALWWDQDRTYAVGKVTADQVLGDADVVMVPKLWWEHYITTNLLDVVQVRLQRDFTPHESQYWTAWVKR